jgi:hypothetical protein
MGSKMLNYSNLPGELESVDSERRTLQNNLFRQGYFSRTFAGVPQVSVRPPRAAQATSEPTQTLNSSALTPPFSHGRAGVSEYYIRLAHFCVLEEQTRSSGTWRVWASCCRPGLAVPGTSFPFSAPFAYLGLRSQPGGQGKATFVA